MRSTADYERHAEECQNMAARVRSEAEKVAWLKLAESWLRVMRTQAELSPDEQFDTALTASGTGQEPSEASH